jgi:hypothetical protein
MKLNKLIILIGVIGFILSVLPFAINIAVPSTSGRINPHWDNWPYDFNYYRSIITQGKNGQKFVYDKYTTENQSGSLLRVGYLFLGRLANILNIDETAAYHLARMLLSAIFIFITYLIIQCTFEKKNSIIIAVFILCLFIPGYPELVCNPNCHLAPRLWSMTQLDPIRRLTFLPHFLWGQIAFLLLIYIFVKNKKISSFILAGIFLGIAGLDHPASLLLLIPVFFGTIISLSWKHYLTKEIFYKFMMVSLILLPFIVYLFYASNVFPWNLSREADFKLGANFFQFSLAMGPTYMIGIVMAIIILISRQKYSLALIINASWLITITLLTFLFNNYFDYSQTRFLQVAPQIPSAVLTGLAIYLLYNKIIRNSSFFKKRIWIFALALFIIFIPTFPTLYAMYYDQIDYEIYFAKNSLPNIPYPPYIDYPPKEWMEGINWLKEQSKPSEIVLSDFTAGNFIPTYGGNTVYYGHKTETYNATEKEKQVISFFTTDNQRQQTSFLFSNKIDYVFFGPQEKSYRNNDLNIKNIKVVYKNSMVTIYKYLKK